MRRNNYIFIFVLALITFLISGCSGVSSKVLKKNSSVEDIVKFIKETKVPEKYKDSGAVVLDEKIEYTLGKDGRKTTHIFKIIKIQKYKGIKDYSDRIIGYNTDNEEIVFGKIFTVTKDGKKVDVPKNQSIVQSSGDSIDSPMYIHYKHHIINLPKVEVGSTIVIDYTRIDNSKLKGEGFFLFQKDIPVLSNKLTISYPKERKINLKVVGEGLERKSKIQGNQKIEEISKGETSQLKNEVNQPNSLSSKTPKVLFTFYENWKEVGEKLKNIKIQETPEVKKLGAALIKEYKEKRKIDRELTREETVEALYDGVLNHFETKKFYISENDFKGEDLDKIIYQKYGDEAEIVGLFLSLLKVNGIEDGKPILKLSSSKKNSKLLLELPMTRWLVDLLVKVDDHILDLSYYSGYMDEMKEDFYYIEAGNDFKPIKNERGSEPSTIIQKEYRVGDEFTLSRTNETLMYGNDYQMRRLKRLPNRKRYIYFMQHYKEVNGDLLAMPKFSDFDDRKTPMSVEYILRYNNFYITQGKYIYFNIPKIGSEVVVSIPEREQDYEIYDTKSYRIELKFDLSDLTKIKGRDLKIVNDLNYTREFQYAGKKAVYRSTGKVQGKTIIVTKELYIPNGIVKKEDYPKLREFILDIDAPIRNKIFIKSE